MNLVCVVNKNGVGETEILSTIVEIIKQKF